MNPHKGDVTFQAGEKTYTMRFSHLALVKLERATNRSLIQIMGDITKPDGLRIGTVVSLLWAGLQTHHPEITEEGAANLLDEIDGGVAGVMPVLDEAFGKAFAANAGTKGTNPTQKDGNGTGTTSSSSSLVTDMTQKHSGTLPRAN